MLSKKKIFCFYHFRFRSFHFHLQEGYLAQEQNPHLLLPKSITELDTPEFATQRQQRNYQYIQSTNLPAHHRILSIARTICYHPALLHLWKLSKACLVFYVYDKKCRTPFGVPSLLCLLSEDEFHEIIKEIGFQNWRKLLAFFVCFLFCFHHFIFTPPILCGAFHYLIILKNVFFSFLPCHHSLIQWLKRKFFIFLISLSPIPYHPTFNLRWEMMSLHVSCIMSSVNQISVRILIANLTVLC